MGRRLPKICNTKRFHSYPCMCSVFGIHWLLHAEILWCLCSCCFCCLPTQTSSPPDLLETHKHDIKRVHTHTHTTIHYCEKISQSAHTSISCERLCRRNMPNTVAHTHSVHIDASRAFFAFIQNGGRTRKTALAFWLGCVCVLVAVHHSTKTYTHTQKDANALSNVLALRYFVQPFECNPMHAHGPGIRYTAGAGRQASIASIMWPKQLLF